MYNKLLLLLTNCLFYLSAIHIAVVVWALHVLWDSLCLTSVPEAPALFSSFGCFLTCAVRRYFVSTWRMIDSIHLIQCSVSLLPYGSTQYFASCKIPHDKAFWKCCRQYTNQPMKNSNDAFWILLLCTCCWSSFLPPAATVLLASSNCWTNAWILHVKYSTNARNESIPDLEDHLRGLIIDQQGAASRL